MDTLLEIKDDDAAALTQRMLGSIGNIYVEIASLEDVMDSERVAAPDRAALERSISKMTAQLDVLLHWLTEAPLEEAAN